MAKHLVFSETHEKYTIDDYIKQGDNGPWHEVVPLHDFDLMTQELEEVKESLDKCGQDYALKDYDMRKLRTDLALAVNSLKEIRELTFGPHEKPHATIFKIIQVVKKAIGLNDTPKALSKNNQAEG